ncbi:propionate catabolism operon regulatory protein PrpR [Anaeromyxobacter oryzae]|uniref:Propionate catabolism operon regulatory protein PrpR n=1 Tax=Anaeromyxobacter oryzae TaxID=2918170 RepID=A0ABM7WPW1_9BACT|nr:propionate catabolism operon regulatory protein PrpR [Anaeromyxobacter oryzae]BDG01507.1 propionate catabolism operon regulatory protein PrpR [Anaeromyxobacter oryzae]
MTHASATRPVVWAFSTSRLRKVFESVAPRMADVAEVRVFDKGFEEALKTLRELRGAGEVVDVLVAAGSNGAYLRDHADLPVVVVGASTVDALAALVQARRASPRIGVVNFVRVVPGLEQARDILDFEEIAQLPYVSPEEARAHVGDLAARGFEVIVGPGPVCDLAEQAGLEAVLLYGTDSLSIAVQQAADIAKIVRAEAARRQHLQRVVDRMEVAIAAVDANERVVSVNPMMQRLLGISEAEALGRPLSSLQPQLGLDRVLESGAAEHDSVERLGSRTVVASRIPLRERGVIEGAVLACHDETLVERLDQRLRSRHRPRRFEARYSLDGLLGDSPAIRDVRELAERYARTDATVLVTGESGTGKELVAQGIHAASRRAKHPFVAINCAAFPETLLESELFGYEEGAFTGSRRGGRPGLFEAAHLGTIFLDEIGDLPVMLQTRLLRVLQERQVLRLGSNDPTPVDVRVVAATHRDLRQAMAAGQFRSDLYFRLHILPLHIPALRERPGDTVVIASELLKRALARHGVPGAHARALALVRPQLEGYAWPGNVRELENVLERLALLFSTGAPPKERLESSLRLVLPELLETPPAAPPHGTAREAREKQEMTVLRRVVAECGGNVSEAARRLGIGRSTIYRKLGERPG